MVKKVNSMFEQVLKEVTNGGYKTKDTLTDIDATEILLLANKAETLIWRINSD